jgi:hypothetical protein
VFKLYHILLSYIITIILDAINTYLCVLINFIFVFLTSGQDGNSGMQKRIHFWTDRDVVLPLG